MTKSNLLILLCCLSSFTAAGQQGAKDPVEVTPPNTMRLDYFHTGNAKQALFSVDEVVIEPNPWPGNPDQPIDTLPRGKYLFEVFDSASHKRLYSRSFSSIYGEWEISDEAKQQNRTFHESLRFPAPQNPIEIVIKQREYEQDFKEVWRLTIDPKDQNVNTAKPVFDGEVFSVINNGPPADKVDLLIMGDGYSRQQSAKFHADVKRLTSALFATEPFKSRQSDFNVWAVLPASDVSGVSRPSTGSHKNTPLQLSYDIFGSERYVLTYANKAFRQAAAMADYEFVEIIANGEVYGGGGIYGLYGTTAADNQWSEYVFIHEFGHHFAGLADEYYSSPAVQGSGAAINQRAEPYEPNVTANTNRNTLKWHNLVLPQTPIPTPWDKAQFDQHSYKYQQKRREIRQQNRPEAEMEALFQANSEFQLDLFKQNVYQHQVGLFEGANYAANGYYRSQQNCIMFTRYSEFCSVCSAAIEQIIDLYSGE